MDPCKSPLRKTAGKPHRRLAGRLPVALAAALVLTVAAALPAAADPPAAEPGAAVSAPSASLSSFFADWLLRLVGLPGAPSGEPTLDGGGPGSAHGNKSGPVGPLIDPNGATTDPRPRNDGGPSRG